MSRFQVVSKARLDEWTFIFIRLEYRDFLYDALLLVDS